MYYFFHPEAPSYLPRSRSLPSKLSGAFRKPRNGQELMMRSGRLATRPFEGSKLQTKRGNDAADVVMGGKKSTDHVVIVCGESGIHYHKRQRF